MPSATVSNSVSVTGEFAANSGKSRSTVTVSGVFRANGAYSAPGNEIRVTGRFRCDSGDLATNRYRR